MVRAAQRPLASGEDAIVSYTSELDQQIRCTRSARLLFRQRKAARGWGCRSLEKESLAANSTCAICEPLLDLFQSLVAAGQVSGDVVCTCREQSRFSTLQPS
jgi:hypothetical protein